MMEEIRPAAHELVRFSEPTRIGFAIRRRGVLSAVVWKSRKELADEKGNIYAELAALTDDPIEDE